MICTQGLRVKIRKLLFNELGDGREQVIKIIIAYVKIKAIKLWNEEKVVCTSFLEPSFSHVENVYFIRLHTTVREGEAKSNTPQQLQLEQQYVNVTLVPSIAAMPVITLLLMALRMYHVYQVPESLSSVLMSFGASSQGDLKLLTFLALSCLFPNKLKIQKWTLWKCISYLRVVKILSIMLSIVFSCTRITIFEEFFGNVCTSRITESDYVI